MIAIFNFLIGIMAAFVLYAGVVLLRDQVKGIVAEIKRLRSMKSLLLACAIACGFSASAQSLEADYPATWRQSPVITEVKADSARWKTVEILTGQKPGKDSVWVYSALCDCWNVATNSNQPYFKSTCKQRRIDKVSGTVQKREVEIIYREESDNSEYEKAYQLFIN